MLLDAPNIVLFQFKAWRRNGQVTCFNASTINIRVYLFRNVIYKAKHISTYTWAHHAVLSFVNSYLTCRIVAIHLSRRNLCSSSSRLQAMMNFRAERWKRHVFRCSVLWLTELSSGVNFNKIVNNGLSRQSCLICWAEAVDDIVRWRITSQPTLPQLSSSIENYHNYLTILLLSSIKLAQLYVNFFVACTFQDGEIRI